MCAVKQFKMLAAATVAVVAMAVGVTAQTGDYYCEIELTRCPEAYDGDTLKVPLNVVGLSPKIRACVSSEIETEYTSETPAIMFIIQNTSSMANNPGNDRNGNRFRIARAIIDSVYRKIPSAQIGMVVFDAGLFLHSGRVTDPNLVAFGGVPYNDPAVAREQYMPLLPLNGQALPGGFLTEADSVINLYRRMLVDGGNNGTSGIRNPSAGGGPGAQQLLGNGSGTNVSIAFEAAQEQFAKTSVAPKNQYIIFISDGRYGITNTTVSYGVCDNTVGTTVSGTSYGDWLFGNSARCPKQRDFMAGEIGGQKIPTTYTIFLNTDAPATMAENLATLDTMTLYIRNNGYSTTNSSSGIWSVNGNTYSGLLNLMMDKLLTQMVTTTDNKPRSVTVISGGVTETGEREGEDSLLFGFKRMLPIDSSPIAEVKMKIEYLVVVEKEDPVTGLPITEQTYLPKDYLFWIQRTENPPANWTASQGLVSRCADDVISVLTPNRVVPQSKPPEEATVIAPMVILSGEFVAGPNPISKWSGIVNFYRQGRRVANCELRIYDATGNHIKKIKIKDNAIGTQAKRIVGSWDLTDKKGKIVSEGTYLVKGVIKTSDGKSEKVSVIIGVR